MSLCFSAIVNYFLLCAVIFNYFQLFLPSTQVNVDLHPSGPRWVSMACKELEEAFWVSVIPSERW